MPIQVFPIGGGNGGRTPKRRRLPSLVRPQLSESGKDRILLVSGGSRRKDSTGKNADVAQPRHQQPRQSCPSRPARRPPSRDLRLTDPRASPPDWPCCAMVTMPALRGDPCRRRTGGAHRGPCLTMLDAHESVQAFALNFGDQGGIEG